MTLPIDLQFKGIGRIHVRSGTYNRSVRDAMKEMLRILYRTGYRSIVRDVKAGKQSPLLVYEYYRSGKLHELPGTEILGALGPSFTKWLEEKELATDTVSDYERALATVDQPGKLISDLPELLAVHRAASRGVHPRTFNQDRSAFLSYLASTVGEEHPLYAQVRRVAPLKIPDERKLPINPQTVAELVALAPKFALEHHARTMWTFALTGMRPEEMFEQKKNRWKPENDRVRIDGTKNTAARRVVPKVGLLVKPATGRLAFYRALRQASGHTVTPIDLRRTYSQLLDLARIPAFRQDHYMGHGPRNIGEHYKRMKECLPYLLEDAAALGELVAAPLGLRIVK